MSEQETTSPTNDAPEESSTPPADSSTPDETPSKPTTQTYDLRIDPQTLKQQQALIEKLLGLVAFEREQLAGVLALLQAIAQQAYDRYGLDALLAPPVESLLGYVDRQQISAEELLAAVVELTRRHPDGKEQVALALTKLMQPEQLRVTLDSIVTGRTLAKPVAPVAAAKPSETLPTETGA